MSKSLKKILVTGASLLMIASTGAGVSQITHPVHAKALYQYQIRPHYSTKTYKRLFKRLVREMKAHGIHYDSSNETGKLKHKGRYIELTGTNTGIVTNGLRALWPDQALRLLHKMYSHKSSNYRRLVHKTRRYSRKHVKRNHRHHVTHKSTHRIGLRRRHRLTRKSRSHRFVRSKRRNNRKSKKLLNTQKNQENLSNDNFSQAPASNTTLNEQPSINYQSTPSSSNSISIPATINHQPSIAPQSTSSTVISKSSTPKPIFSNAQRSSLTAKINQWQSQANLYKKMQDIYSQHGLMGIANTWGNAASRMQDTANAMQNTLNKY